MAIERSLNALWRIGGLTPASRKPARMRSSRASAAVSRPIRHCACFAAAACVVTAAVYMVARSQSRGRDPDRVTPLVLMISVDCVQPIGLPASDSARWRIAVAPFGKILSRAATWSAMPSCCRTFATWIPAVEASISGTKIASAASNASRSAAASLTVTRRSPARTASAVSTRPMSTIEAGATQFSSASLATMATVRIMMSALVPACNLPAMAPTAPNSPAMSRPVSVLNRGARLAIRPWAAPPLRMLKAVMSSIPSSGSGCRSL